MSEQLLYPTCSCFQVHDGKSNGSTRYTFHGVGLVCAPLKLDAEDAMLSPSCSSRAATTMLTLCERASPVFQVFHLCFERLKCNLQVYIGEHAHIRLESSSRLSGR